jgi:BlaI family penicillinase repressor
MDEVLPELSDLEREVMLLIWAHGPATAERIRKELRRKLTDSTVRTVLRRMEAKGYVTHSLEGRTYLYRAVEPQRRVAAKAVRRIIDWLYNGSVEDVLVGMVDANMLDGEQLKSLATKIAKAKAKK